MMKLQKDVPDVIAGIVLAALVLNIWYLSALAIDHRVVPTTYDYFINALVVFTAAFVGAYSAFLLNEKREERKNKESRIDALYASQSILARQLGIIKNLAAEIKEYEKNSSRHILQPASRSSSHTDLRVDIKSLEFLLRSKEPNLLQEIMLEQERFESAVRAFNDRVNYLIETIQPSWDKLKPEIGAEFSLSALESAIAPRKLVTIMKLTDDMYWHIDKSVCSLLAVFTKLNETARKMYPEVKFLGIADPAQDEKPAS